MRPDFTRPERPLRSELLSLLAVALVPLGIMSVFPYNAIHHSCNRLEKEQVPIVSFVFLTEEKEFEAVQRARSAWQTASAELKGLEIDLSLESLPEIGMSMAMEVPVVHNHSQLNTSSLNNMPLVLPSLAEKTPDKVKPAPVTSDKLFSYEDLMKLK